jgi:hypothetical protein
MPIPSSLLELLGSFDMNVRTGSWYFTLDDFLSSDPKIDKIALADSIDALLKDFPSEAQLADELISIECFYAPADSYHAWLLNMALCLREWADPKFAGRQFTLGRPKRI